MLHLGSVIVSSYCAKLINQHDAYNREKVETGANGAVWGLCGRKMCSCVLKNIECNGNSLRIAEREFYLTTRRISKIRIQKV